MTLIVDGMGSTKMFYAQFFCYILEKIILKFLLIVSYYGQGSTKGSIYILKVCLHVCLHLFVWYGYGNGVISQKAHAC